MACSIMLTLTVFYLQVFIFFEVHSTPDVLRGIQILNNISKPSRFPKRFPLATSIKNPSASAEKAENCHIKQALKDEIAAYKPTVDRIFNEALHGNFQGRAYRELAEFVSLFGRRVVGSEELEKSIDYLLELMKANGLDDVHGEEVVIPREQRMEEIAELIEPVRKQIKLVGQMHSIGTPLEGITAETLVVKSFEDLEAQAAKARGKIVVFNQEWQGSYKPLFPYRNKGAAEAAKHGAIATLISSINDFSLYTPHSGGRSYVKNVTKIPVACISVDDAEWLYQLQQAVTKAKICSKLILIFNVRGNTYPIQNEGKQIKISLKIIIETLQPTNSRNAMGQITGNENPEELVALTGHIDSSGPGQGVLNAASGTQISLEALYLLNSLGLKPRRTLQAILWTSEEVELLGATSYAMKHEKNLKNLNVIFESDGGTFDPIGLDFGGGTEEAACIVQQVLMLLESYGMNEFEKFNRVSSDITVLQDAGVPGLSLKHDNIHYFWFQHTEGDVLEMLKTEELDRCTAIWAAVSFVLANLTDTLPREPIH